MKTRALIIIALVLSLTAGAQTVNVYLKSGEIVKYSPSEFDYIDYTLEELPPTYQEFYEGLTDEYSMFKSMLGNYTDVDLDKFEGTILIFSDEVINQAVADARERLKKWNADNSFFGHTVQVDGEYQYCKGCPDEVMTQWIRDAILYSDMLEPGQLKTDTDADLTSLRGKQWRTSVQQVDTEHPVELLNGMAYNVTRLHIPNNVLIHRIKDYFNLYEKCSATERSNYFSGANITFNSCTTEVEGWTPLAGVWPKHENRVARFDKRASAADSDGFWLNFTPIMYDTDNQVKPYLIPPGHYRLATGSQQNSIVGVTFTVYADGKQIGKSDEVWKRGGTAWHYDRGTALPNRYPDNYDPEVVRSMGGTGKVANYDTDGGETINDFEVPDLNGDGTPVPVTMRIECADWDGGSRVMLHHWCLRPTADNY